MNLTGGLYYEAGFVVSRVTSYGGTPQWYLMLVNLETAYGNIYKHCFYGITFVIIGSNERVKVRD